ncbi:MAG: ABC transporter substrate-binding protein [Proteobacteria bacterium]|nr:ABC transporter substrate-binding protein [Pseudomonadota bacterium]
MNPITRRAALGALAAAPLARPAIVRAQSTSKPVKIGLLSDMNGPYRTVGGPGSKIVTQMAIDDFGGSVLGRKIEILQADCQDKPNVSSAIARQWIDSDGVNLLGDGAATSSGLGIQQVSTEKKVIYLVTGPAATDFTDKLCSPVSFHFGYDTYALAKNVGGTLTKQGGKTWFFITADYEFGYSLRDNTEKFVKAAGGKVLGDVRAPLGTADFSSYLIQAKASGAQVIGLANAGTDLQNCLKQAAEFGITKGGQRLATLLMAIVDVISVGQKNAEGLVLTNSFYWNLTPQTAAWAKRFESKINQPPAQQHAALYTGVLHWLKAVKATGSLDGPTVAAKMRAMKVNDFYNKDVSIEPNGRVLNNMYLWEVKAPTPGQAKWDFYKHLATTPGKDAFQPLAETGCPLLKT